MLAMNEQSGTICAIILGNISAIIQGLFLISTITIAIIGFKKFRKRQIEITRLGILQPVESDIINLFKTHTARIEKQPPNLESRELRAILDNEPKWVFTPDESSPEVIGQKSSVFKFIDGERYWLVGTDLEGNNRFLASQAFQETHLWFRRVERAHRTGVIIDNDLADLWRWILPFGFSGRLAYFAEYFQGDKDIATLVYVINSTLRHCLNKGLHQPLQYFKQYVTDKDREKLMVSKKDKDLHNKIDKIVNHVQTTHLSN